MEEKGKLISLDQKFADMVEAKSRVAATPQSYMGIGGLLHMPDEHRKWQRLNEENDILMMMLRCGRSFDESAEVAKKCADWRENRKKELGIE